MNDKQTVINHIRQAFGRNEYPGDRFLQGSFDGPEPAEAVRPFRGQTDWQTIEPVLLDAHSEALNFFSEAGLRFFLPAYLIADLQDKLHTADPVFVLSHGFSDLSIEHRIEDQTFIRRAGRTALVNPRRYGATTFFDYARWRLSVFTREEAQAIVAYLRYKRDVDPHNIQRDQIEAALELYWLERIKAAPPAERLRRHLAEEEAYLTALTGGTAGESDENQA